MTCNNDPTYDDFKSLEKNVDIRCELLNIQIYQLRKDITNVNGKIAVLGWIIIILIVCYFLLK